MTLAELARRIGATLHGDGAVEITGCAAIDHAGPGQIAFVANPKYASFLRTTKADAVLVEDAGPGIPHLQDVLEGRHRSTTGMGVGIIGGLVWIFSPEKAAQGAKPIQVPE